MSLKNTTKKHQLTPAVEVLLDSNAGLELTSWPWPWRAGAACLPGTPSDPAEFSRRWPSDSGAGETNPLHPPSPGNRSGDPEDPTGRVWHLGEALPSWPDVRLFPTATGLDRTGPDLGYGPPRPASVRMWFPYVNWISIRLFLDFYR